MEMSKRTDAARIRELVAELYHVTNSAEVMRKELAGVYAGTHAIVPTEPTSAMLASGVMHIIDSGLDGPDGVGTADAARVYRAMIRAAQEDKADE